MLSSPRILGEKTVAEGWKSQVNEVSLNGTETSKNTALSKKKIMTNTSKSP